MQNVSLSTVERVPGVMTGREFCERVASFTALYEAKRARQQALDWKGINVELLDDGKTFSVPHGWMQKAALKAAGFRWVADSRRWETDDTRVVARCPELVRKSKGEVRDALRSVIRMQNAREMLKRAAAERLEPGDVERIRAVLGEPMLAAFREAMNTLAGFDSDKATIRNGQGFSKADTELGHALALDGVRQFPDAALARKLAWKYRAQLSSNLLNAIFPVVSVPVPPPALTMEQAQEFVDYPVDASILEELEQTVVAIKDGIPEPDLTKPPFMRETRTPVARVEAGAVLLLVSKGKKLLRMEVRTAA